MRLTASYLGSVSLPILTTVLCAVVASGILEEDFNSDLRTTTDVQIRVDQSMAELLQDLFTSTDILLRDTRFKNDWTNIDKKASNLEREIEQESGYILKYAMAVCLGTGSVTQEKQPCREDPNEFIKLRFQPLYNKVATLSSMAMPKL